MAGEIWRGGEEASGLYVDGREGPRLGLGRPCQLPSFPDPMDVPMGMALVELGLSSRDGDEYRLFPSYFSWAFLGLVLTDHTTG